MINLEQVKLLETKVAKAVDYVERLAKENAVLHRQEAELQARLESYQKRIDELEVLVMGFKEDQGRIEEGILSALDRLSQFEKAMEKSLREKSAGTKAAPKQPAAKTDPEQAEVSGDGQTCFEIPEGAAGDDIPDPLEGSQDKKPSTDDTAPAEGEELDIF
jgi:FtsZ-binding cell division protein ZapB